MADLYELIERVQVTLASSRSPGKEQLRELHKELDGQIRHANKRLRECDALLANGHRTEAIQLSEQEPALLDIVSVLDFAELPEWNDFVAELGLTVAPELQIDIAADLNRAYSEDAPLEQLLRRFRLYSLARAPLRTRIAMLKKIANLDAENPVWQRDQCAYEEVRLRQIKDEFRDANRNDDMEKLRELAEELRGKWLIQPGRRLADRVNQAIRSLNSVYAVDRLRQIADELQTAREQDNLHRAQELSREWDTLAGKCKDSEDLRELSTKAGQTLNWVKQEQTLTSDEEEFARTVERLQRALDWGRDLPELQRRYVAATRNQKFELPDEIQQDYRQAILNDRLRRRNRLIIGAAGIVLLCVLIGVVIWMSR